MFRKFYPHVDNSLGPTIKRKNKHYPKLNG